ncbi:MAG: hypothetical protein A2520_10315 [Deltaproteobacteria bacterium RIFOXYD12_FULL_53_23]|nr:MAG: hypothetical protein A2520_10315 [Deltaproteobacteria bacterium RIFOXYD12_FULL_53_23]
MKLHDLPLSMRITGSAMILVAIGALTLLFVEEAHLREVYFSQRQAQMEKAFRTNELRLTQAFVTLRRDVQFLANVPPVYGIMRAARNNGFDARDGNTRLQWEARLQQILSPFLLANPNYHEAIYIEVAGQNRDILRLTNHDEQVKADTSSRPHSKAEIDDYTATLGLPPGQVHLSDFVLHLDEDRIKHHGFSIIRASVPVFDSEGKVFGLIVLSMDISSLLQITNAGLPVDVLTCVADRQGRYLPCPDALDTAEAGNKMEVRKDFSKIATLLDPQSPNFLSFKRVATQADPHYLTAGRIHYNPDDPAQFLLLIYRIPDMMGQQFITIPRNHILAGFTTLFLICAIVFILLHRIFAPLRELTLFAEGITAGTDNVCLPASGGGEIGSLTEAISAMLTALSRKEQEIVRINTGLEQQVAERTHELTVVNNRLADEMREVEILLQRNQTLMQTAMDGIHLLDMQGNLVEANPAFCRMLGYSQAEAAGLNVTDWDAQWTGEELWPRFRELIGGNTLIETVHRRKDGSTFEVEIACSGIEIAGQGFLYAASRDISERKKANLASQHQQDLLNEAQRLGKLGSWELDWQSGMLLWSDEVYRIFEIDQTRFRPSYENFLRVIHPEDREMVDQAYRQSLTDYQPYNIEHRLLFEDGRVKWLREHCTSFFGVSGEPLRSLGMVQDITEQRQNEEEIRSLAFHDQLTGLANRRYFLECFRAALSASVRHDSYGAVLFLDMDNFKTLNDTRGHEAGDLMLIEVAARLRVAIRDTDTVARFGGDEFVVLMVEELGNDCDDALHRAGLVAERIRKLLAQPYPINDFVHHSSPSIGVALYHGKRYSMDALLQHADAAMYQAKHSGRNKVCFFESE